MIPRISLFVLIATSLICQIGHAGPVDLLARHICHGEPISWKGVLAPDVMKYEGEFVSGSVDEVESNCVLKRCEKYTIETQSAGIDKICFEHEGGRAGLIVYYSKDGITGFTSAGIRPKNDSFQKISSELGAYPGEVAVVVKGGDGKILFSHEANKRLATGSSFKLYILRALLEDIKAGKRSWSDVVILDEHKFSKPSGIVQNWSNGSPVTLNTLATLMISISDNTATDILIDEVGRERLEAMMPASVPFLKTHDYFVLKWNSSKRYLKRYIRSDVEGKRRIVKEIASYNLDSLKPPPMKPIYPDKVEWFASPDELSDTILSMKGEPILAVNPGVVVDRKKWRYVGYKGGSEPGVIQYTQLLQSKSGRWYVISASWNNNEATVDDGKLAVIVERLANLI